MNFAELYSAWRDAPFGGVALEAFLPTLALVLASVLILGTVLIFGEKRTDAWRFTGLAISIVLILAAQASSLGPLTQGSPTEHALRASLAQEASAQGAQLPAAANNSYLWHELHTRGSATVGTPDGDVVISVNDDGTLAVTPPTPADESE